MAQFTRQLAKKEAALEQKLAAERKRRQKELKKSQLKVDRIWNFITRQQAGTSSTVPLDSSLLEEQPDEHDEDDTTNFGNDSHL